MSRISHGRIVTILESEQAIPASMGAAVPGEGKLCPVCAEGEVVFDKGDSMPQTVFVTHAFYVFSRQLQLPPDVIWPLVIGVQGGGLGKVSAVQSAAPQ